MNEPAKITRQQTVSPALWTAEERDLLGLMKEFQTPDHLTEWAALSAAKELAENWVAAMGDGSGLGTLIGDIDGVVATLQNWKVQLMTKLNGQQPAGLGQHVVKVVVRNQFNTAQTPHAKAFLLMKANRRAAELPQAALGGYQPAPAEEADAIAVVADSLEEAKELVDHPISCPNCNGKIIYVMEVTMQFTGRHEAMIPSQLFPDGFLVTIQSRENYPDESTDDEIAQCSHCGHRGSLAHFGFSLAQDNAETVAVVLKGSREWHTILFDSLSEASTGLELAIAEKNAPAFWIVERPEIHYSLLKIPRAIAATQEAALEAALNDSGKEIGMEYLRTLEPHERQWTVRDPRPDEIE